MIDPAMDQLEALIDKRAKGGAAQREREETWKASAQAHREKRRREKRALWFEFFSRMADSHARLSEDFHRFRQSRREGEGGGGGR